MPSLRGAAQISKIIKAFTGKKFPSSVTGVARFLEELGIFASRRKVPSEVSKGILARLQMIPEEARAGEEGTKIIKEIVSELKSQIGAAAKGGKLTDEKRLQVLGRFFGFKRGARGVAEEAGQGLRRLGGRAGSATSKWGPLAGALAFYGVGKGKERAAETEALEEFVPTSDERVRDLMIDDLRMRNLLRRMGEAPVGAGGADILEELLAGQGGVPSQTITMPPSRGFPR